VSIKGKKVAYSVRRENIIVGLGKEGNMSMVNVSRPNILKSYKKNFCIRNPPKEESSRVKQGSRGKQCPACKATYRYRKMPLNR
jgi:hypothetical protein